MSHYILTKFGKNFERTLELKFLIDHEIQREQNRYIVCN